MTKTLPQRKNSEKRELPTFIVPSSPHFFFLLLHSTMVNQLFLHFTEEYTIYEVLQAEPHICSLKFFFHVFKLSLGCTT
jgi:hypothetical protein